MPRCLSKVLIIILLIIKIITLIHIAHKHALRIEDMTKENKRSRKVKDARVKVLG